MGTFNRALIGLLPCILLLSACSEKSETFSPGWTEGGTLRDKTYRDWAFATEANRMATSAEITKAWLGINDESNDYLRMGSVLIERCLTQRAQQSPVELFKIENAIDSCIDTSIVIVTRLANES